VASIDRPDLRVAEQRSEVAAYAIRAERGVLYPSLALVAGANAITPAPDVAKNFMWRVGLQAHIPIFAGGRNGGRIDASKARAAQASAATRMQREGAEIQVRAAHGALARAMASVTETDEALRLAEASVQASETRFGQGGGTLIELQQAQLDYAMAQARRTQAYSTAARAKSELDLAVSGGL
jgi:outer membrane protein